MFLSEAFEVRFTNLVKEMGLTVLSDDVVVPREGKIREGSSPHRRLYCLTLADSYLTGKQKPSKELVEALRE